MSAGARVPGRWAGLGSRLRGADLIPRWQPLLGWTIAVGALCFLVRALVTLDSWSYAMVWPAVAPQLVALLYAPRRHWPAYLISFGAVQIVPARLIWDLHPELGVLATMTTVTCAALLLDADRDWVSGRSDSLASWRRFLAYGVYLAPLVGTPLGVGSLLANGEIPTDRDSLTAAAIAWFLTEAVGIAFLVPLMLRWPSYRRPHSWREVSWFAAMTALTVALSLAAAGFSSFMLVFMLGLPALLVLIRSGIAAAFVEMAVGSAIVLGSTFAGYGPFATSLPVPAQAMVSAQVFVLAAFTMVVIVAAALEDRMRLVQVEHAGHKAYELVAELTGDIVILVDAHGTVLRLAAPGLAPDLPDGRMTKVGWLEKVHPDDRDAMAGFPESARPGAPSVPFRMRRQDGSWGWYVVHSRRTADGITAALLRDVTHEREVQDTLTDMAHTDPLTGLANRRGLAHRAAAIWRDARESGARVTALFIDLDHFKAFNDHYGHRAGDECLRLVAGVLQNLADPNACVAARYGGEEFAVVLAACDDPRGFAGGLASAIRALKIPHPASRSGFVTVSVGVATVRSRRVPPGTDPQAAVDDLLHRADKALYVAKFKGRDGVARYAEEALVAEQVHRTREHAREAAGSGHDE